MLLNDLDTSTNKDLHSHSIIQIGWGKKRQKRTNKKIIASHFKADNQINVFVYNSRNRGPVLLVRFA